METDFYPVGAVIAYGGELEQNDNWLFCDGRELKCEDYPELFTAIDYMYGGNTESRVFKIPDYLGIFLRGATRESTVDPDADKRQTQAPSGITVSPREVGSVQGYATKLPATHFTGAFAHLPVNSKSSHGETQPDNTGPDGSEEINTCTTGGDKETRPKNVYVNYYIKARS